MTQPNNDFIGIFIDEQNILSNFAATQISWRGEKYATVEHAYQTAKFFDTTPKIAKEIAAALSPWQAQIMAKENRTQRAENWSDIKLDIMREIIAAKFSQHKMVRDILRSSGNKMIIEMNDNDDFWGWGNDRNGENWTGKIWMEIRESELYKEGEKK